MIEGKTIENLRSALEFCGYDLDEIMTNRTRRRTYTDLRSIVWSIYCNERNLTCGQVGRAFGWDHSTIYYSLSRARDLRKTDRVFADMYDSIHGAYLAYSSKEKGGEAEGK